MTNKNPYENNDSLFEETANETVTIPDFVEDFKTRLFLNFF